MWQRSESVDSDMFGIVHTCLNTEVRASNNLGFVFNHFQLVNILPKLLLYRALHLWYMREIKLRMASRHAFRSESCSQREKRYPKMLLERLFHIVTPTASYLPVEQGYH
eukprot:gb/GECG01002339.1/.p1 GENE.gb/GECG01002339.1/~~gb/GECG01002339.1/.p1  ORF type:complete len:109 (+),score=6.98 gb/GECG01002339.1/:1-327(+)